MEQIKEWMKTKNFKVSSGIRALQQLLTELTNLWDIVIKYGIVAIRKEEEKQQRENDRAADLKEAAVARE